jgi:uncharacterized protein (TIGR04255 family)
VNDPAFNLRTPPIIEAIVDIECDFKHGQDLGALEAPARQRFSGDYPKFRSQFLQELHFQVSGNEPARSTAHQGLQALQFLKGDERQLVQVRASGYSFNRLAPYTSFDEYLPEIRRTWDLYRDVASPIQIKSVRLRYINRIHLPLTEGSVKFDEYLQVGSRPPDEERLMFRSFLTQYNAVDADTGHQVTSQRQEPDGVPVIFDNGASATLSGDPDSWDRLNETLNALRALKNRVFRNTLTPKCLSLFQ